VAASLPSLSKELVRLTSTSRLVGWAIIPIDAKWFSQKTTNFRLENIGLQAVTGIIVGLDPIANARGKVGHRKGGHSESNVTTVRFW
jgi:hypothetical protein